MNELFARFAADESAATATEYGLIAAGIGVAIVSIVGQVGPQFGDLLDRVVTQLQGY
ncbi:MAG: Flp family type IVb pilin [Methyloceanibacter sp.]|nr:Flp family type IVb pilin [Methyloceanibacter sp.]